MATEFNEVLKTYPKARVMSGTVGKKVKYRIENAAAKRSERPISPWCNTQDEAWIAALKRIRDGM